MCWNSVEFTLKKASDDNFSKKIYIKNIMELKKFYKCVIVDFDYMEVTIFDEELY